ncbi:Gfo/Idh/MocA family oxidoreductase [Haliea sp. E1-2-M8]|uniref:Gfo/Idh/MocA family protein n=1 Tax=Haliea sp. E1-2-M8 TaxID=3064706 RepID=UPI002720B8B0|nr:Gfo/Idh/MocA family oxidoreductase [Haliea sp. E1-2-M8]MDO8861659.1 Gfo/Idh/MocA family oxidoreductase [Haliea sp. E1-2-M8]
MSKFSSALIGCGMIGSRFSDDPRIKGIYSHAGAYDVSSNVTLGSLCDTDKVALSECARHWGIENTYSDVAELLEKEKPEIVSICTPDETHAAIFRRILDAESIRGVLIEKPIGLDVQEVRDLITMAAERGVVLAVNYSRRYSAGFDRARQLIKNGGIGEIQLVSGYYTKGVLHNGTHWFDLARYLVGAIDTVRAAGRQSGAVKDPTLDVQLKFASGAEGVLYGCSDDQFSIFEMDILGSKGRVRILDSGHKIEESIVEESKFYSGYNSLSIKDSWDGEINTAMVCAIENLVECVSHGGVPRCSGYDGLEALKIGVGAIKSWKTCVPVTLGD